MNRKSRQERMLKVFLLAFSSEKPLNNDKVVEKVGKKES